jgi:hypothetical protein
MGAKLTYRRLNWKIGGKPVSYAEVVDIVQDKDAFCRHVVSSLEASYDEYGAISIQHLGSGIVAMITELKWEINTQEAFRIAWAKGDLTALVLVEDLAVEAEIGDETDRPHYCGNESCDWECGVQDCGACIDVCRCS